MRILLTGATGYIGKRLLPALVSNGNEVICCVRDAKRFNPPKQLNGHIEVVEVDFLKKDTLKNIPDDIDAAYYLIHSMSGSSGKFNELESESAHNFNEAVAGKKIEQVIYLSGIVNEDTLSKHLASRKEVENILSQGNFALTTLRAGIIVGSGSASFEIIRDLVEKLPVMVTPRWLNTRCQPVGITDVILFLSNVLHNKATYNDHYDIGGPDVLTYKEMLLGFAKARKLKRWIFTLPIMTPKLSSYWLFFVTSTSYRLAVTLVDSMKVEVVCSDDRLARLLGIKTISYAESLAKAFSKINQHVVASSWKDSLVSGRISENLSEYIEVPVYGCLQDKRSAKVKDSEKVLDRIWALGGETGWYYGNWLWKLRGFLDKLVGGVGLRRGRTNVNDINAGDSLDFWRVLYANRAEKRLLLFAEMKVPGEAWLEFSIDNGVLYQTATFRPRGLWGRLYWYSISPIHGFVFDGMLRELNNTK
ncbi:SDR family oxidoreductase [uncultured Imperialibacter sp.]|uniref:SDR family oxidoreductase n=1 Tax=uncultured Imperialibacter sp. TaxID=1672639 RepID=UPI0030DAE631|tara:strand:- start:6245 stop:7669 length:1425 start_codon:yes stop_codon:yes gene_type:complete